MAATIPFRRAPLGNAENNRNQELLINSLLAPVDNKHDPTQEIRIPTPGPLGKLGNKQQDELLIPSVPSIRAHLKRRAEIRQHEELLIPSLRVHLERAENKQNDASLLPPNKTGFSIFSGDARIEKAQRHLSDGRFHNALAELTTFLYEKPAFWTKLSKNATKSFAILEDLEQLCEMESPCVTTLQQMHNIRSTLKLGSSSGTVDSRSKVSSYLKNGLRVLAPIQIRANNLAGSGDLEKFLNAAREGLEHPALQTWFEATDEMMRVLAEDSAQEAALAPGHEGATALNKRLDSSLRLTDVIIHEVEDIRQSYAQHLPSSINDVVTAMENLYGNIFADEDEQIRENVDELDRAVDACLTTMEMVNKRHGRDFDDHKINGISSLTNNVKLRSENWHRNKGAETQNPFELRKIQGYNDQLPSDVDLSRVIYGLTDLEHRHYQRAHGSSVSIGADRSLDLQSDAQTISAQWLELPEGCYMEKGDVTFVDQKLSTFQSRDLVFDNHFDEAPEVLCWFTALGSGSTRLEGIEIAATAENITPTGFSLVVRSEPNCAPQNYSIQWMAYEQDAAEDLFVGQGESWTGSIGPLTFTDLTCGSHVKLPEAQQAKHLPPRSAVTFVNKLNFSLELPVEEMSLCWNRLVSFKGSESQMGRYAMVTKAPTSGNAETNTYGESSVGTVTIGRF